MNNWYAICLNEWIFDDKIRGELSLLLYISCLTAESWYCYAWNEHFSKKFKISKTSISTKLKKLEKLWYIEIFYKKRWAEITERQIRLKIKNEQELNSYELKKLNSRVFWWNKQNQNTDCEFKGNFSNKENLNRTNKENLKENNIMNNNNINYFKDDTLNNSFLDFIEHRKQIKCKMTDLAIDRMVKKIEKWQGKYTNMQIVNFINESISNGRKWIFERKIDENEKKERTPEEIKEMLEFAERFTS